MKKLLLNKRKYEFGKESLVYHGHIVVYEKMRIDPKKVKVIIKWPRPTNITKIRSVLEANEYKKIIENFSVIASP